mgnify:FL=1
MIIVSEAVILISSQICSKLKCLTLNPMKHMMKNYFISSFGAFICLSVLSYLNNAYQGSLWLIPPFGASMVLVMAVYESPLASPKNVFFGHLIAASCGVFVYFFFGLHPLSIGFAVALAIFLMSITKTIHPPAGANPIIAIMGGEDLFFVLMPVAIGAGFIIIFAIIFHRLIGQEYPCDKKNI